jgi:peptide chain release factor 1
MQDERSQIQNRARALKYLRAKLFDFERQKQAAERSELRSAAQGTGDRSDKIRTYNFPQDRITDHRINLTLYNLDAAMNGEIAEVIEALKLAENTEKLKEGNS